MAEVLIAALSPIGHIGPLLNVAQGLVDRGDQVTVLSGANRAAMIRAAGATPHPIPAAADFDDTRLDADNPGPRRNVGYQAGQLRSSSGSSWRPCPTRPRRWPN